RMFGRVADLGPIGCATAPVSNWWIGSGPARWLLHRLLGIHAQRRLPSFSRQRFSRWFRSRPANRGVPAGAARGRGSDRLPGGGLEPSCTVTLTDEYPDLAPGEAADRVARQTFMIEEFLVHLHERGIRLPFGRQERRVLFHGHCHQKAMVGTQPSLAALRWL